MPVGLDPQETYRYVISTDRSKPPETQPALIFHYATCKEARQIANLFDEADKGKTVNEAIDKSLDAVRVNLVGWENMSDRKGNAIPFDPAKLDEVLTDTDITELRVRLLKEMSQSEVEKKRAVFFAPSSSDNSAANAPANASTNPPNNNQQN